MKYNSPRHEQLMATAKHLTRAELIGYEWAKITNKCQTMEQWLSWIETGELPQ